MVSGMIKDYVAIPVSDYERLVDSYTRLSIVEDMINSSRFAPSKSELALVLGIEIGRGDLSDDID